MPAKTPCFLLALCLLGTTVEALSTSHLKVEGAVFAARGRRVRRQNDPPVTAGDGDGDEASGEDPGTGEANNPGPDAVGVIGYYTSNCQVGTAELESTFENNYRKCQSFDDGGAPGFIMVGCTSGKPHLAFCIDDTCASELCSVVNISESGVCGPGHDTLGSIQVTCPGDISHATNGTLESVEGFLPIETSSSDAGSTPTKTESNAATDESQGGSSTTAAEAASTEGSSAEGTSAESAAGAGETSVEGTSTKTESDVTAAGAGETSVEATATKSESEASTEGSTKTESASEQAATESGSAESPATGSAAASETSTEAASESGTDESAAETSIESATDGETSESAGASVSPSPTTNSTTNGTVTEATESATATAESLSATPRTASSAALSTPAVLHVVLGLAALLCVIV